MLYLAFLLVACLLVQEAAAECRWTGCHAHSAGDWCNTLGPGFKVNKWERCNGLLGKLEYCCN